MSSEEIHNKLNLLANAGMDDLYFPNNIGFAKKRKNKSNSELVDNSTSNYQTKKSIQLSLFN